MRWILVVIGNQEKTSTSFAATRTFAMVLSMQPGKRRLSSRQLHYFLLCLLSFSKCPFECNNTMIALVDGYITCIVYLHLLFLNYVNGLSCDCWADRWIAIHLTKRLHKTRVDSCTSKSEVKYPSIDTWQVSSVGKAWEYITGSPKVLGSQVQSLLDVNILLDLFCSSLRKQIQKWQHCRLCVLTVSMSC